MAERITFDDIKNMGGEDSKEFLRLEDKKTYNIIILSDEIQIIHTKYGKKYLLEVEVEGKRRLWLCSLRTLKKISEDIDKTKKFIIRLDREEKRYDIIPIIDVTQ